MKKNVILFDVFKTLILFDGDHVEPKTYDFISKWLTYRGYLADPQTVRYFYEKFYGIHIEKSPSHDFPDVDAFEVWKDILRMFNVKEEKLSEISKEICLIWRQITTHNIELYPKTFEMLEACKQSGFKLCVASNTQRAYTEYELNMLGLSDYFDSICFSSDFKVCKPDKLFFEMALDEINENPENVIYVGDNPFDDVKGASTLNIPTILLERGTKPKNTGPLPKPYATIFDNKVEQVAEIAKKYFNK